MRDFLKLKHVTDLQKYGSLTTRLLLLGIAESSNNIKKPSMIMLVAPPSLRTMQVQQQEWMRTTERKNRMKWTALCTAARPRSVSSLSKFYLHNKNNPIQDCEDSGGAASTAKHPQITNSKNNNKSECHMSIPLASIAALVQPSDTTCLLPRFGISALPQAILKTYKD